MMLFSCILFSSIVLSVVVAEITMIKTTQYIYDRSPKVRIHGTGFDAEPKDIKLELKVSGKFPLTADKDYMITKESKDEGLVLLLLANRRWADLSDRIPPVALVLHSVKFANSDINLLTEPFIVAQILNTPTIKENTDLILYQSVSNELRINGTGFIGSKKVDLYFQPPIVKEVTYEDITSYPMTNNQVILKLNHGQKWKDTVGKLFVIGVDIGGGPVKVNGDLWTQVAEVQEMPLLTVEASANNQFLYADEPNLMITGTGFNNVQLNTEFASSVLRFSNGLIYQVNYTIDHNTNTSLSLKLVQGSYWRKAFEALPSPLKLLAIQTSNGYIAVGPTYTMKGQDVAMIFQRPTIYSDNKKKIFKTHTHSFTIKGTGFPTSTTNFKPSLKFEPALQENIDYTIRVIDRTTIEITLMDNKAWRSEPGPLYVIGVNTRGDLKGWIDYTSNKVIVAQVVDDVSLHLRGSTETNNTNNTIDWIEIRDIHHIKVPVSKENTQEKSKDNLKANTVNIQETIKLEEFIPKQTLKENTKNISKTVNNVTFQEI